MHPIVRLLRRYCADYVGRQDTSALDGILIDDYVLEIGGTALLGRAAFKSAATDVFVQFPTIDVSMHEIVVSGDQIGARFTERSSWARGGSAIWDVVTLFRWNGEQFIHCYVEQDFYGRRQQLRDREPRTSTLPGADPWMASDEPLSPDAEDAARAFLSAGDVTPDEGEPAFHVDGTVIDALFGSGDRLAFHVTQHGQYTGGFAAVTPVESGQEAVRHVAGLLTARDGKITDVRSVSDRLELENRLRR